MLFILIVLGSVIVFMTFIILDSMRRKGDYSLKNDKPACPKCGFRIPFEDENPRTRGKCTVCGEKLDFWGNDLPARPSAALPEIKEEQSIRDFKNPLDEKGRTPVERVLHDNEKEDDKLERDEH